jgi:hypothetical protein
MPTAKAVPSFMRTGRPMSIDDFKNAVPAFLPEKFFGGRLEG